MLLIALRDFKVPAGRPSGGRAPDSDRTSDAGGVPSPGARAPAKLAAPDGWGARSHFSAWAPRPPC
jgi:hypothetical protein